MMFGSVFLILQHQCQTSRSRFFYPTFLNLVFFLLCLLSTNTPTGYFRNFVEEKLGVKYTEGRKTEFAKSFRESGPTSPVFFILSPGVDPLKDVESLGTAHMYKLHADTHIPLLCFHGCKVMFLCLQSILVFIFKKLSHCYIMQRQLY